MGGGSLRRRQPTGCGARAYSVRPDGRDQPGAVIPSSSDTDHVAAPTLEIDVENTSDVPISVTSHFHFFEVNPRLRFDRAAAYGMRLVDRRRRGRSLRPTHHALGVARPRSVEPGSSSGSPVWWTARWMILAPRSRRWRKRGPPGSWTRARTVNAHEARRTTPRSTARRPATGSPSETPGSWSQVESDAQLRGDEFLMGFGKTARDGMHLKAVTISRVVRPRRLQRADARPSARDSEGLDRRSRGTDQRASGGRVTRTRWTTSTSWSATAPSSSAVRA